MYTKVSVYFPSHDATRATLRNFNPSQNILALLLKIIQADRRKHFQIMSVGMP